MIDKLRVTVLDMQPIDPPVGGGRLRLLGLYYGLGKNLPTTYIGTYDWPGERFRHHRLSDTLVEIDIPLSKEHFSKCKELQTKVKNKTLIDVTFSKLAYLSPEFIKYAKEGVTNGDVIIFSHPWVYPLVKKELRSHQLIIYDAHNMEGFLRTILLDDGGHGSEILKDVIRVEYDLSHHADLILASSYEDAQLFNKIYKVPFKKIRVVPNGVFTEKIAPKGKQKKELKDKLNLSDNPVAIFIGSAYQPNIEAAHFICQTLAPNLPEITFLICGGVGNEISTTNNKNIVITGVIPEKEKEMYLSVSDIALNPMFSGSGTNIKMFDYFATGLPTITTPVGARGIKETTEPVFIIADKNNFVSEIRKVIKDIELKERISKSARRLVREGYSWERISANLGILIQRWFNKSMSTPFFSVVIPTFERHEYLSKLMRFLSAQIFSNFEVIIVDQSKKKWQERNKNFGFGHLYIHTDVIGAVKARNLGAFMAKGEVLAFTDDDCEPMPDWLKNAHQYFLKSNVIGVEGLIKSDKYNDPVYRVVTNEGFEGIGFLSANLFIRIDVFNAINGFDERFDNPHFREDTDLAWRALQYGEIPFAHDVVVYHPPHKRDNIRESVSERAQFFEKDPLLLKKHPERYMELFLNERNWEQIPGFWENFFRGAEKYGVKIPDLYFSFYDRVPKS